MRKVRVHGIGLGVLHHGLAAGVDLAKYYLVTDVVVLMICLSRDVLTRDFDHVVLVLLHAISDHVLDKPVEGLNLLVNYSILIEVSIDDFPLIIHADLVFAIILNFWKREWLAANRRINLAKCSLSCVIGSGQIRVHLAGSLVWCLQRSHNFK
jgi:hypothetical protein